MFFTVFTTASPDIICNNTLNETQYTCKLFSNYTEGLPSECEFDNRYYGNTIITEWNLICKKKYLASLTQTIYMIGALFSISFGWIADLCGRRKSIVGFLILLSVVLLVSEFLQLSFIPIPQLYRYIIYCVHLFLSGCISNILYGNSFGLLMELTTAKYRTISSILVLYAYVLGELLVVLVAYFIRDWHIYNWISVGYSIIVMSIALVFVPESPRWLVTKKKNGKADWILSNIAKKNNRIYRRKYFKAELNSLLERRQIDECTHDDSMYRNKNDKCRTGKNTILLMFTFMALSLTYYGISLGITSIKGLNPYIAYIFSCIFEMIGYTISIVNEKIGRKKTNILFLFISTISCFFVGYMPYLLPPPNDSMYSIYSIAMLSLVSISKCMVCTAFNNIWIYASELYPTSKRNSFLLLLNGTSRIGALIAPFINLYFWERFPYLIFSAASLLAGIFGFFLRETMND
jgi:MFS family permease